MIHSDDCLSYKWFVDRKIPPICAVKLVAEILFTSNELKYYLQINNLFKLCVELRIQIENYLIDNISRFQIF